jgi:hypothetical protein
VFYRIDIQIFDRPFISRSILIKFDHLKSLELPSVMFNPLLEQSITNDLVGMTFKFLYGHLVDRKSLQD